MGSKIITDSDMPPWLYSPAWLGTFVRRQRDGREARVIWLRLPSYGFGFDYSWDQERWGQRVLLYHGHQGFRIVWRFLDSF